MTNSEIQHELISALKSLKEKLNKVPTRNEFCAEVKGAEYRITKTFGTFSALLKAAGMPIYREQPTEKETRKQDKRYKQICARVEKIEGFYKHVIDLEELFARAGNPEVLKLSALFDVHAKFVDPTAWAAVMKFFGVYRPHVLLFGGDFVDCEGISHWEPSDLEPRRIVPEMKTGRAMLAEAKETSQASTLIYLEGNHEDWITKAMSEMPEMFDGLSELGIEINLQTLLNFKGLGVDFFPLNHLVKIGKAHFTHGIYCSQNHAAKHLKEFMTNIYYGHVHDTQEVNDVGVDGPVEAACGGCLCRLDAKFLKGRKNKWAQGFLNFEFFPDGSYTVYRVRIIGGRFAYNGQTFGA